LNLIFLEVVIRNSNYWGYLSLSLNLINSLEFNLIYTPAIQL